MEININNRILTLLLVLAPMLDIYITPIPGISIGECLVVAVGIISILKKRIITIDSLKYFYIYLFIITTLRFVTFINVIDIDYAINIISYFLYAFIILLAINLIDFKYFSEIYIKVSRVICLMSIAQYVLMIMGIRIALVIPFLSNTTGKTYAQMCNSVIRATGPFTEPAHLVQYISVALIIALYIKKDNIKDIVLFSSTMLLAFSGNGLVLFAAVWGMKYAMDFDLKNIKRALWIILVAVLTCIITLYLNETNDQVQRLFLRVYEITGNSDINALGYKSASGYFRVKYGFDVWSHLPIYDMLFGVGAGPFNYVAKQMDVVPLTLYGLFTENLLYYRSGITTILIDSGIIGFIIYCFYLFKNRSKEAKAIAVVLLVLQIMSGNINTFMWILYIFLLRGTSQVMPIKISKEELYQEMIV